MLDWSLTKVKPRWCYNYFSNSFKHKYRYWIYKVNLYIGKFNDFQDYFYKLNKKFYKNKIIKHEKKLKVMINL